MSHHLKVTRQLLAVLLAALLVFPMGCQPVGDSGDGSKAVQAAAKTARLKAAGPSLAEKALPPGESSSDISTALAATETRVISPARRSSSRSTMLAVLEYGASVK